MKKLIIEKTSNTPYANFNSKTGVLKLEGRSIPEDPDSFYYQLLDWVTVYFSNPNKLTIINMQLEYINSGSSKNILDIFITINNHYKEGKNCLINWYYEEDDEAVYELGIHYKSTVKIPFNILQI